MVTHDHGGDIGKVIRKAPFPTEHDPVISQLARRLNRLAHEEARQWQFIASQIDPIPGLTKAITNLRVLLENVRKRRQEIANGLDGMGQALPSAAVFRADVWAIDRLVRELERFDRSGVASLPDVEPLNSTPDYARRAFDLYIETMPPRPLSQGSRVTEGYRFAALTASLILGKTVSLNTVRTQLTPSAKGQHSRGRAGERVGS